MRRILALAVAAAAAVTLAGCGGDDGGGDAAETSASSSSVPATTSAPRTTASSPAPATTSTQQVTPREQFLMAMRDSGVVPQFGTEDGAVELATTICAARASGLSFAEVMATLAAGSLSLAQMADLHQAATEFYCPRFYVPEP